MISKDRGALLQLKTKVVKKSNIRSWYYPTDAFDPWPTTTDISCWWCTYNYDWAPFPLPYAFDLHSNRYKTIGLFCGPSCAKAYALRVKRFTNLDNVYRWIESIATEFYGYEGLSVIPIAPDKELLQKYCGASGLTIEQYRSMLKQGRNLKLHPPGVITIKQVVEAQEQVGKQSKTIRHSENPDNIQRTEDLVRIKRIPFVSLGIKRIGDYIKERS
jgi:hypothetical protein